MTITFWCCLIVEMSLQHSLSQTILESVSHRCKSFVDSSVQNREPDASLMSSDLSHTVSRSLCGSSIRLSGARPTSCVLRSLKSLCKALQVSPRTRLGSFETQPWSKRSSTKIGSVRSWDMPGGPTLPHHLCSATGLRFCKECPLSCDALVTNDLKAPLLRKARQSDALYPQHYFLKWKRD
jgi:hypothetical protein